MKKPSVGTRVRVSRFGGENVDFGVGTVIESPYNTGVFTCVRFDKMNIELGFDNTALCLPSEMTIIKKNKRKKNTDYRPLYVVATKNGLTHKGIASKLNERGVNTFGNSVLHALSKWEDKFGGKIDLNEALVFKLVPHRIRLDKRNNKPRLGGVAK
jgi:hypothetical protein